MSHGLRGLLTATVALGISAAAWAQSSRQSHYYSPPLRDDEQIMPSQVVQPPAPKPARPKPKTAAADPGADTPDGTAPKPAPKPAPAAQPAHVVTCSAGAFIKNSGHLRLAQAYGVHNVDFTEVTGDDGSAMMASVIYPNDPKKRLEVLWDDDTERSGTRMIVIEGQSTWSAEKGLRLGLSLAGLEKLNGKTFKLMGFDRGGMAIVSDWMGGALGLLTDGCRVGVQLKPDPKASPATLSEASSDKEFPSNDPTIRAAKPTVGEIIVAY